MVHFLHSSNKQTTKAQHFFKHFSKLISSNYSNLVPQLQLKMCPQITALSLIAVFAWSAVSAQPQVANESALAEPYSFSYSANSAGKLISTLFDAQ